MNKNIVEGSMFDAAFVDLFEAYKDAVKLCAVTNATDARNTAMEMADKMKLAINQLVPFGVHAEAKWRVIQISN